MKRFLMWTALVCFAMPAWVRAESSDDLDRQILGVWTLELTDPEGVRRTPAVIVGRQYQKYAAWYISSDQPEAFRDVQRKGDILVSTIQPQEFPNVTVTLEAKLTADDKCAGIATYRDNNDGDTGTFSFTGQRMTLSAFEDVTTWKLRFVSPDQEQHEPTITVVTKQGNMFAWYSSRDHQLPVRSISVQGDSVVVSMTAESAEGKPIDVTLRGTVTGETVTGTAEYRIGSDSGSFPFQGKRAS